MRCYFSSRHGLGVIGCLCAVALLAGPIHAEAPWVFVSSPDMFNSDIGDLSGGTPGVPKAPGFDAVQKNSITPQMDAVYDKLVREMASHDPEAFLVAGDLINGRWPQNRKNMIAMFDPEGQDLAVAIDRACEIYYAWYRQLFTRNGIPLVIAAIGDHEIGDNDWKAGDVRSKYVINLKKGFGDYMVEPLGVSRQVAGVPARPYGTQYEHGSYAYQLKNVLFVTVDIFRQDDPGRNIHFRSGSVSADIEGAHLAWLEAVLAAADGDASVDHVIVQAHTPTLPAVRKQSSSGMMTVGREHGRFWTALREHSHDRGGKVRFYFGGEVHSVTATKDQGSDLVQLVHGNPPVGGGGGNYIVFTVRPDRIDARLYQFDLSADGQHKYWQPSGKTLAGPDTIAPGEQTGSLTIHTGGTSTEYETGGWLEFIDYHQDLIRFSFDEAAGIGFANAGAMGNLEYVGVKHGDASAAPGKVGQAIALDGEGDYVRSGMIPITEDTARSLAAWVRTDAAGAGTVMGMGMAKAKHGKFNVQLIDGRLALELHKGVTATAAGAPAVNDGRWHHVAVVWPGGEGRTLKDTVFYIDGRPYAAQTGHPDAAVQTFPGYKSHVHIGSANESKAPYFAGLIDEPVLWGRALSDLEVAALAAGE